MSVQLFQLELQELRQIQCSRRKAKMDAPKLIIGNGKATAFNKEGRIMTVQEIQQQVFVMNDLQKLYLVCGSLIVPCEEIEWYSCVDNKIKFHLKDEVWSLSNNIGRIILELDSIESVNKIINKVKPPEKPRPNTYLHDGNVTSSSSESEDSARGVTGGVDNSFESDTPSIHGDF